MRSAKRVLPVTLLSIGGLALMPSLHAATLLSQNFDTDPVNYTGSAFVNAGPTSISYYNRFSAAPPVKFTRFTNTTGDYVTLNDGDGGAGFTSNTPAVMNFTVAKGTGLTDYKFSLSMAGGDGADDNNFIRAFSDNDGDGIYETQLFNFFGQTANSVYRNNATQALSDTFQTFTFNLATPTGPNVNVRLELFNDTNNTSGNELLGFDNILITAAAVPEPSTSLLGVLGALALLRRRRIA